MRKILFGLLAAALLLPSAAVSVADASNPATPALRAGFDPGSKIQHVVVILKENHSFNSVLGPFCARNNRCNGVDVGTRVPTSTGQVALSKSPDVVPVTDHSGAAQRRAWNGGSNDHWNLIGGCGSPAYACYKAYVPSQVPNASALARKFALSDNTSTCQREASWNDKLTWGSACDQNGFQGLNPQPYPNVPTGGGLGCASNKGSPWSGDGGTTVTKEPSCIPDYSTGLEFGGAFKATPVPEQTSLFENCDQVAGCSWVDYNTARLWSVTGMRAYTVYEHPSIKTPKQFVTDAQNGQLPGISFVTSSLTTASDSQHNGDSMLLGDNSIGQEVSAVMNGPDWRSTAIFVTWDDCGCQYDPVAPNRVPMLIVSPYARSGYTDTTQTSFAGVTRFIEETFGLPTMNGHDRNAYDYRHSFDFNQTPLTGIAMERSHVPAASREATLTNPANDLDDS
ncbi:MAG: alkaline phosphatase family protein [Candidatus Nanopelagicales bacterium]